MSSNSERSHTLYRFFDQTGALLYVGRTVSPANRWRDHERKKPWFNDVATVTRVVFEDATTLAAAETAAIAAERPLYNVVGNGGRHKTIEPNVQPAIGAQGDMDWNAVFERRCELWGLNPSMPHDGEVDESMCECSLCHMARGRELDELDANFGFHPGLGSWIDKVRDDYAAGADLMDWYYDLTDVHALAPIEMLSASGVAPVPAYAKFTDALAEVWCPVCLSGHRYRADKGTDVTDLTAKCGARISLFDDWLDALEAQHAWGEALPLRRVA